MTATERTAPVTAVVLAGGPARGVDRLRAALHGADLVIAADGGIALADALGVTPDLWVGDFDSVNDDQRRAHRDIPHEDHPIDKDELDLELAIRAARLRGARELRLLGVFGGRLDQTLAALLGAARLRDEGVTSWLAGDDHEAFVLGAGDAVTLDLPPGTVFSLLSLRQDAVVDVRGARFELTAARLPFGVGLGVSNRAVDGPSVTVHAGTVALLIEWSEERRP